MYSSAFFIKVECVIPIDNKRPGFDTNLTFTAVTDRKLSANIKYTPLSPMTYVRIVRLHQFQLFYSLWCLGLALQIIQLHLL